jgi:PAS domain S-box-containing protein
MRFGVSLRGPHSEEQFFSRQEDAVTPRANAADYDLLCAALERVDDAVLITDADLEAPGPTILFANAAFTRMTGYSLAELVGRSPRLLQGTQTERAVLHQLRRQLERGEAFEGEAINYRKDGTPFHLHWRISPFRNTAGALTHFIAIQHDVSDRYKARAQLEASEERYRMLVERLPDAVLVHQSGLIVYANAAALALFGAEPGKSEQLLGRTLFELVHPDFRETFTRRLAELHRVGWTSLLEKKFLRLDGTPIDVESMSIPISYSGCDSVLVIVHDLTEKKRLEEKFLQAQRLEGIGMLAAGIAHDLNHVLTPILLTTPVLLANASDDEQRKRLRDVQSSAMRGADLVRQITEFSRGAAGEPQPISIAPVLHDIGDLIKNTFPPSIEVDLQLAPDLATVIASPTRIHQVVLNLCLNARDAMPNGGRLKLCAENRTLNREQAARIPNGKPGAWMVLEVVDTGMGILPEVLSRMWEPFFTTKTSSGGTGLGLSTVRGIVAEYHGFMEVQSELGVGTRFRVYLAPAAPLNASSASRPPLSPFGQGDAVLVVDDVANTRVLVSAILMKNGFRVLAASDGREALEIFSRRRDEVRLVVTDLDMPGMSGFALAEAVRQLNPAVRVMAMSGVETHPKLGPAIDAFILKPFTVEQILGLAGRLLQEKAVSNS